MLERWLLKIKELERKQLIIIGVVVAMVLVGAFGMETLEGDHEGDNDYGTERYDEDGEGNRGDGEFDGGAMEGATENTTTAALQLGGVIIGVLVLGIFIKPKETPSFQHVILGKEKFKKRDNGGVDEE